MFTFSFTFKYSPKLVDSGVEGLKDFIGSKSVPDVKE